MLFNSKY